MAEAFRILVDNTYLLGTASAPPQYILIMSGFYVTNICHQFPKISAGAFGCILTQGEPWTLPSPPSSVFHPRITGEHLLTWLFMLDAWDLKSDPSNFTFYKINPWLNTHIKSTSGSNS